MELNFENYLTVTYLHSNSHTELVAMILDSIVLVGETDFKQEDTKAMYIQTVVSAREQIQNMLGVVGKADLRAMRTASEVTFELDLRDGQEGVRLGRSRWKRAPGTGSSKECLECTDSSPQMSVPPRPSPGLEAFPWDESSPLGRLVPPGSTYQAVEQQGRCCQVLL